MGFNSFFFSECIITSWFLCLRLASYALFNVTFCVSFVFFIEPNVSNQAIYRLNKVIVAKKFVLHRNEYVSYDFRSCLLVQLHLFEEIASGRSRISLVLGASQRLLWNATKWRYYRYLRLLCMKKWKWAFRIVHVNPRMSIIIWYWMLHRNRYIT